ncbi:unnamed protein product, partial [Ixodes hexagonus]
MDGFISRENLAQPSGQRPSSTALQRPLAPYPSPRASPGPRSLAVQARPVDACVSSAVWGRPGRAVPVPGPLVPVRSPVGPLVGPLVGLLTREGGLALSRGHRAPAWPAACVSHGVAGEELFREGERVAAEGSRPALPESIGAQRHTLGRGPPGAPAQNQSL